jgi:hypothetical protein
MLEKHVSLPKPMKSKFWFKKSKNLIAKSVSKATWKTRKAALQKILTFSKNQKIKLHWPLSEEILNGFVIWCFANKMSPLTTNSYVFALSSIQKCLGFNPIKIKNSQAEILLKGFKNQKPPSKKLRKPVTLKILSNLKSKIEKNFDNIFIKKAIWSAFTLAFFGCLRMGEIVCEKENSFHSESAFCWGDVKIHKDHLKLNLKNTKNNDKNVSVYIFKFANKNICPYRAFLSYKKIFDSKCITKKHEPVFVKNANELLTKKFLNKFLRENFKFITCHSFRAGIPSAIEKIPNSMFKKQIMSFGRWNSNSFSSYQKYKLSQKKWIFVNIEKALLNKK